MNLSLNELDHWHRYAGHWGKVASPLSPHDDDLRIYAEELDSQAIALLLGVTPQIARLNLKGLAVDHNSNMIRANMPPSDRWTVLQADWLALPLAAGSVAQVAGDAPFTVLRYPEAYPRLLEGLRRVLQANGKCVMRLFVPPDRAESVEDIRADLAGGHIQSFHALKWRLMMSACGAATGHNVRVAEVLDLFNRIFGDRAALLEATGWPAEVFSTIDVYRDSSVTLSFPPRAALDALFRQFATQVRYRTGSYELAERCPIVILEGWRR